MSACPNPSAEDDGAPAAGGAQSADDNLSVVINQVQLILAEKRTSLSVMRTGIAVFALPLSVFSVLIATSNFYSAAHVVHLLIPIFIINIALVALGTYLILRAIRKLHALEGMIEKLKKECAGISNFIA